MTGADRCAFALGGPVDDHRDSPRDLDGQLRGLRQDDIKPQNSTFRSQTGVLEAVSRLVEGGLKNGKV
jgi:hypothetical protein